jgi:hypothetical protein
VPEPPFFVTTSILVSREILTFLWNPLIDL